MDTSARRLLISTAALIAMGGALILMLDGPRMAGYACIAAAAAAGIAALIRRNLEPSGPEPDDITAIDEDRRRELMRGTSLYLREAEYRYSVRLDTIESGDRKSFSAEVNTIHLGFVPAVITDNTTDRQGHGYVAFVHDGERWRGPGLPCPADQVEAVRHAARCVSPLSTDDETSFEG